MNITDTRKKIIVQLVKNIKQNIPINSNANYRKEMKFVLIDMDYCLLEFDALNFFLGVRLHEGSLSHFNFFHCKSPNFTMTS